MFLLKRIISYIMLLINIDYLPIDTMAFYNTKIQYIHLLLKIIESIYPLITAIGLSLTVFLLIPAS